ncbi:MAG: NADPH dehydrogenase [Candidatus Erwinia impunctatus]|nr:NADPH dehydrogenase [Culicoides impunctatus]
MSLLFTPVRIGKLKLANRIVIAPMCQYSAEQGKAAEWHRVHLGNLALSGAGLLIIEATAVEPAGRISPNDLGLWNDETRDALGSVLDDIRKFSPIAVGIQLSHAGRKASSAVPWLGGGTLDKENGGWDTQAPSAIPYSTDYSTPVACSTSDIKRIVHGFTESAIRADHLGIDLIEIHAAHGYLLHQFLSPLTNQRNDEYGGSLDNRMRLTLEVFREVRRVFPAKKPVGIRLSATDWVEGGWDPEQSIILCQALERAGCDYIHVSSGGLSVQQKITVAPGYQVSFAEKIKQTVTIPVITVGLITDALQAETILTSQQADMVALARGILYNPRWPWHAAAQLGAQIDAPAQYRRCEPHNLKGLFES